DVRVGEGTGDLADRLGFADVGEELVAQALTLAGALDDAGDVHEGDGRRQQLLAAEDLGELRQPRVGQRDHADVRIDGRERIVRGEDLGAGQGVEEGGLADGGQAHGSDSKSHGRRFYVL